MLYSDNVKEQVLRVHLNERVNEDVNSKEVKMIAINPIKSNIIPIAFGNSHNNTNVRNHYSGGMPNVAALAIQGNGARASFEQDWHVTKEADAVQSNMLLSPIYKVQKAIKLFQNKKVEAQAKVPHIMFNA